jgi:hypothetical protein
MKSALIILAVGLASFNVCAEPFSTRVSGFIGTKNIDDSGWKQHEDQVEVGVAIDIKPIRWPVSVVAGLYGSLDFDDSDDDAYKNDRGTTTEALLGLRKTWTINGTKLHPYVASGLTYVTGELKVAGDTQKDSTLGYWYGTGIYWTAFQHFDIGVEARYSEAEIKLFDRDVDAGGTHLGLVLGYTW